MKILRSAMMPLLFLAPATAAHAQNRTAEPTWQAVLRYQIESVTELMRRQGLSPTHEAETDLLADGETKSYTLEYEPDTDVTVVGVCDSDCSDLDLGIFDPNGELITHDVEDDDTPILKFNTKQFTGSFTITVLMADCKTADCGFTILSFAGK